MIHIFSLVLVSMTVVAMAGGGRDPDICEPPRTIGLPIYSSDKDLLQFALNLEFLEAEFFLFGSLGVGLNSIAPELAMGGPPPVGARKANLDNTTNDIIEEFGYQEVGHLRVIESTVGGIPRPLLNLSAEVFADIMNDAFGYNLNPPFDPYNDTLKYLIASYVIPYIGVVAYAGANPSIRGYESKRLLAGLLAVEAGQDAVIRTLLYQHKLELVPPYNITVANFTIKISELRNRLAMCGVKDEGLIVPMSLGAEGRLTTNILSADNDSLAYSRTPAEVLRIGYGTGNESKPGGFLPRGGNGKIAREFLEPR
ncbi:ferritin-like catalase Nec2 [Curcuma longa]|uniref:ferritin-like catalase Nec2 n=1 Tax=Curcuma longa TaxID=136217 RepID=UPI003D9E7B45